MKVVRKIILIVVLEIALLVGVIEAFSMLNSKNRNVDEIELNSGWDVNIDYNDRGLANNYSDVDFDGFNFTPVLDKGDECTISTIIPENDYSKTELQFWICLSAFKVYVDEDVVYEFGEDSLEAGEMVGSGYHWITLPDNCSGKKLSIVIDVGEDNAFSYFVPPKIMADGTGIQNFIAENFSILCVALFLIMFGICQIFVAIILNAGVGGFSQLFYTAIFSVFIGDWLMCNKGLIMLISDDRYVNVCIEYLSLYSAPIAILLYLAKIRSKTKIKGLTYPVYVMIFVNFWMLVATVALHYTNKVHMCDELRLYHVFDVLVLLYLLISCIWSIKNFKSIADRILLVGVIIMGFGFAADIACFNIGKYINSRFNGVTGISAIGAIAFIICMVFSLGTVAFKGFMDRHEREKLQKMAYYDKLTNLTNRAHMDETKTILEIEGDGYTVVNFDLNNLKTVNDTLGHYNGDRLLCAFADVLRFTFGDVGDVCRTGGDEFNIIIEGCDREKIDKLYKKYKKRLRLENNNDYPFEITAAYGIAYSDEEENMTMDRVFELADQRMYANKKQMKAVEDRSSQLNI